MLQRSEPLSMRKEVPPLQRQRPARDQLHQAALRKLDRSANSMEMKLCNFASLQFFLRYHREKIFN